MMSAGARQTDGAPLQNTVIVTLTPTHLHSEPGFLTEVKGRQVLSDHLEVGTMTF